MAVADLPCRDCRGPHPVAGRALSPSTSAPSRQGFQGKSQARTKSVGSHVHIRDGIDSMNTGAGRGRQARARIEVLLGALAFAASVPVGKVLLRDFQPLALSGG